MTIMLILWIIFFLLIINLGVNKYRASKKETFDKRDN